MFLHPFIYIPGYKGHQKTQDQGEKKQMKIKTVKANVVISPNLRYPGYPGLKLKTTSTFKVEKEE